MLISIPPTYAVSHVIGYIKGKNTIHIARVYGEVDETLWTRTFKYMVILYRNCVVTKNSYNTTQALGAGR